MLAPLLSEWDAFCDRQTSADWTHTTHPVMASFERGERWAWRDVDQTDLDVPARVARSLR